MDQEAADDHVDNVKKERITLSDVRNLEFQDRPTYISEKFNRNIFDQNAAKSVVDQKFVSSLYHLPAVQSPSLITPDSDDILGVLDYTPDGSFDQSWPGEGSPGHYYGRIFTGAEFQDMMPQVFISRLPVRLRLTIAEQIHSPMNIFSTYMLDMELQHGSYQWTLHRTLRQVSALHRELMLFKTKLKLPAATKEGRLRRESVKQQMQKANEEHVLDPMDNPQPAAIRPLRVLRFPGENERMTKRSQAQLETYLQNLLLHPVFRNYKAVIEFFEVSPVSFIQPLGEKLKEGFVKKRIGGYNADGCCSWFVGPCLNKHNHRWLVLKETCLFFLSVETGLIRGVMLMDSNFQVTFGTRRMGLTNSIIINNLSRSLVVKCESESSKKNWYSAINSTQEKYARDFTREDRRYNSFAPVRCESQACWYVDAARFMWDVADIMECARDEIFITGWWLSPEIYLKRPDLTGSYWRLTEVLRRQALRGVRVFILLYKEVELALGISSIHSKMTLRQLHPNIHVFRHPDHYNSSGVLYWAHHEKMVIVDQAYAFISGTDLAFGRWDDYRHRLVDVGHGGVQPGVTVTKPKVSSTLEQLIRGSNELLLSPVTKTCKDNQTFFGEENQTVISQDQIGASEMIQTSTFEKSQTGVSLELKMDGSEECIEGNAALPSCVGETSFFNGSDGSSVMNGIIKSVDECDDVHLQVEERDFGCDSAEKEKIERHEERKEEITDSTDDVNRNRSSYSNTIHQSANNNHSVLSGDVTSDDESQPVNTHHRTKFSSRFFHRGQTEDEKSHKEDTDSKEATGSDSEDWNHEGRVSKSLKAVKNIGIELIEEVREKSSEMKAWSKRKLPHLARRGSSGSELSDIKSEDETNERETHQKSFHLRIRRSHHKLGISKMKGSSSSLAQSQSALFSEDTTSVHLWVGKDYVNWIAKDLNAPSEPFKDTINRMATPRMPWHDIGLFVEGAAAKDAARHFIQRWNAVKNEKAKTNEHYPYLVPKSYSSDGLIPSSLPLKHQVKCQVLRSVGKWSAGLEEQESSIFTAYIDLIRKSKHYLYIENQFLISCADTNDSREVKNFIAKEIVERILRAHRNKKVFRVYVLLPLLPAFEGMIGKSSGVAMQYIVHWNYVTICRGKNSIIECLERRGINSWKKYISFCSLRQHGELEGRLVSELIYIHSKLMIVDDRFVIAGSANINDRSMNGNRDSEVALVIEDEEFDDGIMNGKPFKSGRFAGSMRRFLFSEHLGLLEDEKPLIDISDPVCQDFFEIWTSVAAKNTKLFEEVFNCYPSDQVVSFQELEKIRNSKSMSDTEPTEAKNILNGIQGHLVSFPLSFLEDELLLPGPGTKEYLLPMDTWV